MESKDFALLRDMFRSFAARHRVGPDGLGGDRRSAAQKALGELGLADLRGSSPPAATVQECALLAEEHGAFPLPTSFLGTVLLAPELLHLLGAGAHSPTGATATIALATDLRFPTSRDPADLVAWDCEGADAALCLDDEGMVTVFSLGSSQPSVDLVRGIRPVSSRRGAPIGRLDDAALQRWQAFALIMVSSELVGAARSFVDQAVGYARDRYQYGRVIGSFQSVQHLLADATVAVEACTSAVRYAAWCLDHEPPETALTAARCAKAETNVSALNAVHSGMQVFGGIAQTWEHIAHLYLRKALSSATAFATTGDLLTVLATEAVR